MGSFGFGCGEIFDSGVCNRFRSLLSASADVIPNGEEQSIGPGDADANEDLSTLALVRGDFPTDRMQIESASVSGEATNDADKDDEKWREPWSREELEQLAITMQDFEVCDFWICTVASARQFITRNFLF